MSGQLLLISAAGEAPKFYAYVVTDRAENPELPLAMAFSRAEARRWMQDEGKTDGARYRVRRAKVSLYGK